MLLHLRLQRVWNTVYCVDDKMEMSNAAILQSYYIGATVGVSQRDEVQTPTTCG